jgi:hypothetical protein
MSVLITDAVEITAAHMSQSLFVRVKIVDGAKFFEVNKHDKKVERLLCDDHSNKTRTLANTSIIETVTALRNSAFWGQMDSGKTAYVDDCNKRRRYRKPGEVAHAIVIQDSVATVTVPPI